MHKFQYCNFTILINLYNITCYMIKHSYIKTHKHTGVLTFLIALINNNKK